MMAHNDQTRSMLQTDQSEARRWQPVRQGRGQPHGSTDVYFGPTAPEGMPHNWMQTVPGKGFFVLLGLYNPETAFFDKSWRPSEIEPI